MKSTLTETPLKPIEMKFPCLMQLIDDPETVVLFAYYYKGVAASGKKLGNYSNTWVSAEDITVWKPFEGQITLQND